MCEIVFFSLPHIRKYVMSMCVTVYINLDQLFKMASARM